MFCVIARFGCVRVSHDFLFCAPKTKQPKVVAHISPQPKYDVALDCLIGTGGVRYLVSVTNAEQAS